MPGFENEPKTQGGAPIIEFFERLQITQVAVVNEGMVNLTEFGTLDGRKFSIADDIRVRSLTKSFDLGNAYFLADNTIYTRSRIRLPGSHRTTPKATATAERDVDARHPFHDLEQIRARIAEVKGIKKDEVKVRELTEEEDEALEKKLHDLENQSENDIDKGDAAPVGIPEDQERKPRTSVVNRPEAQPVLTARRKRSPDDEEKARILFGTHDPDSADERRVQQARERDKANYRLNKRQRIEVAEREQKENFRFYLNKSLAS